MATLHSPFIQLETSAGVPSAGAKLYFYAAGTTTPITVYTDSGIGTPHDNPVVADASGIFAPIWVNTSTYKVVLKTSADVTLQTIDNIAGNATFSDSLFTLQDGADTTKQAQFQLSSITTATTRTITLQDVSGTMLVTGGTDVALADGGTGASLSDPGADRIMFWDDSAGTVGWLAPDGTSLEINTTTINAVTASQAVMEAASNAAASVTAARQHFHPGHPKCWAYVPVSGGTPSIGASYNVTSITDTGTGQLTITIATDFSDGAWAGFVTISNDGSSAAANLKTTTKASGSILCTYEIGGVDSDPGQWNFVGFGDLA